jgi:hypothetical protein
VAVRGNERNLLSAVNCFFAACSAKTIEADPEISALPL